MERLLSLRILPGLYANGTRYQAKGRWYRANLVRWFNGDMGPIGGWVTVKDGSGTPIRAVDTPRATLGFRDNANLSRLAIGGPTKLYMYNDGTLTDITPAGLVTGVTDGSYVAGSYGTGTYGTGLYGTGTGAQTLKPADTWQLDNYGELMVSCLTSDGHLFICLTVGAQATIITNAPTNCVGVVVTPERFVVALGAGGDPRLVQWASQQTTTTWTALSTNSAGQFPLSSRGRLMAGRRSRSQTLLWTDVDLYAMSYIGGTLIYRFDQVGDNCGLIGPNAVANCGDVFYWMSPGKFFAYDGAIREIACDVLDYVFGNLQFAQQSKVTALPMSQFNEVWWFYPSSAQGGRENDSYVSFNYKEQTWAFGSLARNVGIDRGTYPYPMMWDSSGFLYQHEVGNLTDSQVPYAESGPIEVGEGDQLLRVQKIYPDEKTLGDVSMTLFSSINPTDTEVQTGPFTATAPTDIRVTARQVRLRVDQVNVTSWKVGVPRLGVLPGGYR